MGLKQYYNGIVQRTKSRDSKTHILVVVNEQYGTDDSERASTICEEHGWIVSHRSIGIAKSHAPKPTEWCEPCADVKDGKCRECGEVPGWKPSGRYTDGGHLVPGTCDFCNNHYLDLAKEES
jgi:hypothetical protein